MAVTPPAPNWVHEFNFILWYIVNPCNNRLILYFETARETAWDITVSLAVFDWEQFLTTIFRKKTLRTRRHGRKGRRGSAGFRGIPAIDEVVAEWIEKEEIMNIKLKPGFRTYLIDMGEVIDRVAWNFFVYASATDLAYQSILGVIKADKSKCPNLAQLYRRRDTGIIGNTVGFGGVFNHDILEFNRHYYSPTGFGLACTVAPCFVAASGTLLGVAGDREIILQLWGDSGGGRVLEQIGPLQIPQDGGYEYQMSARAAQGEQVSLRFENHSGFIEQRDLRIFSMPVQI
jgi:hypothetical protein